MSRRRAVMTPAARARAQRRALKQQMKDVAAFVERQVREGLAVLDEPALGDGHAVVLEGRVVEGTIVIEAEAELGEKA
jgi:hypothetical protein